MLSVRQSVGVCRADDVSWRTAVARVTLSVLAVHDDFDSVGSKRDCKEQKLGSIADHGQGGGLKVSVAESTDCRQCAWHSVPLWQMRVTVNIVYQRVVSNLLSFVRIERCN